LYKKLLRASVYLSDGISKSISVVQYGETVTVERSRAKFHLDEENDGLRLYVPRDDNGQEECYLQQLPKRLMKYMGISDLSAEALLISVIGCRTLVVVDSILATAGVLEIDGLHNNLGEEEEEEEQDEDEVPASDDEETYIGDEPISSSKSRASYFRPPTPIFTSKTEHVVPEMSNHSDPTSTSNLNSVLQSHITRPLSSIPLRELISSIEHVDVHEDLEITYATLLEAIIDSAGRVPFPMQGITSVDEYNADVVLDESLFATRSIDRDRKVGAAGELFVSFDIHTLLGNSSTDRM